MVGTGCRRREPVCPKDAPSAQKYFGIQWRGVYGLFSQRLQLAVSIRFLNHVM